MTRITITLLLFWVGHVLAGSDDQSMPAMNEKNGYVQPFQMFDNVYYVGDKWVSAYAVDTQEGIVLIDTLEFPYSKWLPANLEKLGLNPESIGYILITHGHSDHVGGANYLQSLYDSKVMITAEDYKLAITQAQKSSGDGKFSAPAVEVYAEDGDILTVGDTTFKLYVTPGHTKGCLSIDFNVRDRGKAYRAFVVGGNGTNFTGFSLAKKYLDSVHRIRGIAGNHPRVSVNLANHPRMNQLFENRAKLYNGGSDNPFIDESAFFEFLDLLERRGIKKLKEESPTSQRKDASKPMQTSAEVPTD